MAAQTIQSRRTLHPDHYFIRSQQPLHSLVFLIPLLAVHELGMVFLVTQEMFGRHVLAWIYLENMLELFGAVREVLPPMAVVVVLVCLHVTKRDGFRFDPRLYVAMLFESLALAIPLLLFGLLLAPRGHPAPQVEPAMALATATGPAGLANLTWKSWVVLSLGAGIYEEFLFRLMAIAVLHLLFVDVLRLSAAWGAALSIGCSAVLFAAYHFTDQPVGYALFAFYFASGVYFAIVYVLRGFGIAAATHAFYDLMVFAIMQGIIPAK
jgi:membrane protease YdiL (CAAX protease family)